MLRLRVITALVLVGLLLGSLALGARLGIAWPFAALTLALMAAAGWEWGRLNQAGSTGALVMARPSPSAVCWRIWPAGATAHRRCCGG